MHRCRSDRFCSVRFCLLRGRGNLLHGTLARENPPGRRHPPLGVNRMGNHQAPDDGREDRLVNRREHRLVNRLVNRRETGGRLGHRHCDWGEKTGDQNGSSWNRWL